MTGSVGDILERSRVSVKWEVGNGASARQSKRLCRGHVQRPGADRKAAMLIKASVARVEGARYVPGEVTEVGRGRKAKVTSHLLQSLGTAPL